jgi:hypothetical protein
MKSGAVAGVRPDISIVLLLLGGSLLVSLLLLCSFELSRTILLLRCTCTMHREYGLGFRIEDLGSQTLPKTRDSRIPKSAML